MMKRRRWRVAAAAVLLVVVVGVASQVHADLAPAELEARYATPPSRFVEVDGLRVHYRDVGQGPVLLLLHGSNASLFTWEGWARALSGRFRVVSLDLPGHGLTGPDPKGRYRPADMAQVVEAFRARLGVERMHVAGNSMGGMVAWTYALQHPGRVDRLVLVDAAGYPRETPPPLVFRLMATPGLGELFSLVTPRAVVERNVRAVYGDPSKVTEAGVRQYHELLLRQGNRAATRERLRLGRDEGTWKRLGEVKAPTLVLWGAKDTWIPPSDAERFDTDIQDSRRVVYPGLGHVPMEEDPERTAQHVAAFLDETTPAGGSGASRSPASSSSPPG